MILNRKENKEAHPIPSKIYEGILLWKKKKKRICWFINISGYHPRTMGLITRAKRQTLLEGFQVLPWVMAKKFAMAVS